MKSVMSSFHVSIIVACVCFSSSFAMGDDDIVIADFEGSTYGDWTVEGTAFGADPARGTLPGQMHVGGFLGKGLVNSFFEGDGSTGTLTSPEFKIDRRYLRFLIGGGGWEGKTCVNLLVDGKVVRTAVGPNTVSGGSEELGLGGWDLAEFKGQKARIQIVDAATGGWGHINVDQIVLTDEKPPLMLRDVKHEIIAESRWLQFPIKTGGPKRKVTLVLDGVAEPPLDMELADQDADWWAPREIRSLRGRAIQIIVDRLPQGSRAFEQIKQGDTIVGEDNLYRESLRPQLHFSPRRGWNNDPNGMVYFEGAFHLFFQHNPYGWGWGNMHWGHAVSSDMVHWQETAETLYPDRFGPMFSGSGVIDWKNSSGFGRNGVPPIVLFYTAAGNPTVQCLAWSDDRGKTFTKFAGNPVLGQITGGNRDPKVIFHAPSNQWVMTLYVGLNDKVDSSTKKPPLHTIQFFTSSNLKDWKYTSQIEGFYECPDLFSLPLDGDDSQTKWILTAANSEYMVGLFDGQTFIPETPKLTGHRGRGFYAAQTFSDIPKKRRVQIGWLQANSPGMPFNQAMSFPLELSLKKTNDGPRLCWQPIDELKSLRLRSHKFTGKKLSDSPPELANDIQLSVQGELLELDIEFKPSKTAIVTFLVRGIPVVYDSSRQELTVNGHKVAAPMMAGQQRLLIYVDRTALEIFASDGLTYIPFPVIPKADALGVSVQNTGGDADFSRLDVHELNSIWMKSTQ